MNNYCSELTFQLINNILTKTCEYTKQNFKICSGTEKFEKTKKNFVKKNNEKTN